MGRNADAIAEGVAIATSAARLTLRNQILVGTIARGGNFDLDKYVEDARDVILRLAEESELAAERLGQVRKNAHGRYSDPMSTHDYRERDVRNLRRRTKQSTSVSERLRAMAADDAALAELVEQARVAAWDDVRSNLDRTLRVEGMRPDQDPDYSMMREARMQALRLVDLQALASQRRSRSRRDAEAKEPAESSDE